MIRGGRYRELVLGRIRVTVNERISMKADAYLFEENVRLGLCKMNDVLKAALPLKGGTAITAGGLPAEIYLIVDELEKAGGFRPGWLEPAWEDALRQCDRLHFERVAAPLIGCIGGSTLRQALLAFAGVAIAGRYANLRHVELVCGPLADTVFSRLKSYAHFVRN